MKVFVTGGAGFLGRALIHHRPDWEFTVYSRDEKKQVDLKHRWPKVKTVLGDILDRDRLVTAMTGHDLVIHAAAVKFIPEAEENVAETYRVNIEGSQNVAWAALNAGVETVIGISTDKACSPTTTYGLTKLAMERLWSEADGWSRHTRFVCVRYGNVVGSTGSVIPRFFQQLDDSRRLSITDPESTRFWLPPSKAVDVISWANAFAPFYGGCVFVPICPAMELLDLARTVYELWWEHNNGGHLEADCTLPADIIGARPAEKRHEVLLDQSEAHRATLESAGFVLRSPLQRTSLDGPAAAAYSSDHPQRWVGAGAQGEMADWILEAQQLAVL